MSLLHRFIDLFLHLDTHLDHLVGQYGAWVYLLLFVIVFCETGLVVTPILPGDSMLFAAGAIAARDGSPLHPGVLVPLLICAALLGDNLNYFIGRSLGPRVFTRPNPGFLIRSIFITRAPSTTVTAARR